MKRSLQVSLIALAVVAASPTFAETTDELRQQLEAQKALNAQLRQRVLSLERQLAGGEQPPALNATANVAPLIEPDSAEATTAIEEALVARGLVLLPSGTFRVTPKFSWVHSGADRYRDRSDSYIGSLGGQAGLPWGMMFSASIPYTHRSTSIGSNSGVGDVVLELAKKLNNETERLPSFLVSLSYAHDNGDDPFEPVPVSYGFRSVTGSLSALKRFDPVALYGGLAYSHAFSKNVRADDLLGERPFSGRIEPGDSWAFRLGASLAATPDISLDTSLSWAFIEGATVDSDATGKRRLSRATVAALNLGATFMLTRDLALQLSAAAGATDDSPDYSFSIALPYRF